MNKNFFRVGLVAVVLAVIFSLNAFAQSDQPYKYKNRCIQSEKIGKWVVAQDKKVAKFLKLKPNSIHTAKEVFNLAMDKINGNTIKSVCKDCIFLDNCIKVGINNSFRKDLNKN